MVVLVLQRVLVLELPVALPEIPIQRKPLDLQWSAAVPLLQFSGAIPALRLPFQWHPAATIAATCCNNSGETVADSAVACGSTGFGGSGVSCTGSACCGSAAGFADAGICGIALASRTGGFWS